jgi:hypothetical protein
LAFGLLRAGIIGRPRAGLIEVTLVPGRRIRQFRLLNSPGTGPFVEERVLGLLAEGALATEQIASNLRVAEAAVRMT